MDRVPMTKAGYEKLNNELSRLKSVERPAVIQAIAEAREHGDLSENAEYHAAREKQGFLEGRISEIESKISRAEVIDVSQVSGDTVKFGATVTLFDETNEKEVKYQIVGEDESDLDAGKVSVTSPFARALIAKEEGDVAEVKSPGGVRSYEVIKVEYI